MEDIKITPNNIRFLFIILAAVVLLITKQQYLVPIAIVTIIGILFPQPFAPFYKVWMMVSMGIGFVVSTILFTLVFFVGFMPIGFLMKLFKQQPLDLSWKSSEESYWVKKKKQKPSLEKQY
jgi:hypothetical protein